MLRTSAITLLSALALSVLGGCTLTVRTYNSSNPPPAKKAAQSQPARRPATATVHPTTVTPTPTKPATETAPKITSPIIFGNGTGGAFTGHAYVIPDTTRVMPDFTTMVPFATLYTDHFDVKAQDFAGGFPGALVQEDWFGIRYDGTIAIPADGSYTFKMISDDGAILYIDGKKVVDDDGRHTVRTATGQATLKGGNHTLRVDYFQALKGTVALQVYLVAGGSDQLVAGVK